MLHLPILFAALIAHTRADVPPLTDTTSFTSLTTSQAGFPSQTFRSSPIVAPIFLVNHNEQSKADDASHIFLGTVYGAQRAGPMVFDARDLSLVYADQQYENTYASDVHLVNGTRHLAFWEGGHTRGHANGNCLFFDESYSLAYNVTAQGLNDAMADMHELSVTGAGTVIFSTYFNIPFDCRPVGGPDNALLMDSGFQEIDLATNELIFDWHASQFFPIDQSYAEYTDAYGTDEGDYLVSGRHTSVLALIDHRTGQPLWILGGKQNQFTDLSGGAATNFSWQHDARIVASPPGEERETHITLFDNHGEASGPCAPDAPCASRALRIAVDPDLRTARLVSQFFHPEHVNSGAMGGYQTLGNGNIMTAWGYSPSFVEYAPDGTPVLDVQRGAIGGEEATPDMFAYRVHKGEWAGRPSWPPSIAADAPDNNTHDATIYVSWNGATQVSSWAIFASDDHKTISNHTNLLTRSPRQGFETVIPLPRTNKSTTRRYVAAAAVSSSGDVLGSTIVLDLQDGGKPVTLTSDIISLEPPSVPSSPSPSAPASSASASASTPVTVSTSASASAPAPASTSASAEGQRTSTSTVGVMGASIFSVAGVFYLASYFWRRRRLGHGHQEGYRMMNIRD
ncbi:ASST domain-containing protein [Trichoderma novae-zelandiae]